MINLSNLVNMITIIGTIISLSAALFTYLQAKSAKKSLKQINLQKLYNSFEKAGELAITYPDFLYSVHGMNKKISKDEARRIAYLQLILDAYQNYYYELYNGKFEKMYKQMVERSTFLTTIFKNEANFKRWEILKEINYGEADNNFIKSVDSLISKLKN
jgi:hypothetical protein